MPAKKKTKRPVVIQRRPAESSALAGALALLAARYLGVSDVDTVTELAVAIGALPTAVTWLVGLIRGR